MGEGGEGGRISLSSVIHTCSARRSWTGIDATLSQCKCCNSSSFPCRFPTKDDSIPKRRPWERGSLSPPTQKTTRPNNVSIQFPPSQSTKGKSTRVHTAHTHTHTHEIRKREKGKKKKKNLLAPLFVIRTSKLTRRR